MRLERRTGGDVIHFKELMVSPFAARPFEEDTSRRKVSEEICPFSLPRCGKLLKRVQLPTTRQYNKHFVLEYIFPIAGGYTILAPV